MTQVDATAKTRATASDRADLLVVGASFAGVACAIEAARAGFRVILIERKTDAGEKLHTTGIVVKEAADDGPTSKVARTFGLGLNREFLFGVEAELTGVALPEPERLHCFLDRRLARGYIGWAFDGVGVTQVGLAARQRRDGEKADLDAFLAKLAHVFDLAAMNIVARRAGLIPVGGPVFPIAGDRVLLVGDAAGLVSPLTAGGIHTALESGRAAAVAITAALARDTGAAMTVTIDVPQFRTKRLLRKAFDVFQSDWLFNVLLSTGALSATARLTYFHRRGLLSSSAWKDLLRR